jgi:hypothetical protein
MQDRLFLLSLDEYNKYVAGNRKYTKIRVPLVHKDNIWGEIKRRINFFRTEYYKEIYHMWWLRTTQIENITNVGYCAEKDGRVNWYSTDCPMLVRPAMKINIDFPYIWDYLGRDNRRNFHNGSVIKIGEFCGKPIKWYVLDEKEGLVLSKHPLFYCELNTREQGLHIYNNIDQLASVIPCDGNCIDLDDTEDDEYKYSCVRFCLQMLFVCMFEGCHKNLIKDAKLYEDEVIKIVAEKTDNK